MGKTIETIMKLWCMVASAWLIFQVLYTIHLVFDFGERVLDNPNFISTRYLFLMFSLIVATIMMIGFYFPFFYYGWVKDPKNEYIKRYTKFMTIAYTIAVTFGILLNLGLNSGTFIENIQIYPIVILLITPLYYFAWVKR